MEMTMEDFYGFEFPEPQMFWLLDPTGNTPVPVDMETWVKGCQDFQRNGKSWLRVAEETLGRSWVSTVFLTVHWRDPQWETMVFGGKLDGWQNQCGGNREQAEAMHGEMTRLVRRAEGFRVWLFPFLDDQIYDWRDWFAVVIGVIRAAKLTLESLLARWHHVGRARLRHT